MASSTGPQWSLYPLLAILSFCTFSLSGAHLFFCLPFYAVCLPLLSGVLGILAAFHAIFLRYPNRTDFVLQLIASIASSFFFFSSSLETFCLSDAQERTSQSDICDGVYYRSEYLVDACRDFLGPLQRTILARTGWEWDAVRIGISSSLTALAAAQLLTTTALTVYSAHETKLRIRTYHYQLVLGILLLIAALFHWRFCCLYYFISIPLLSGVFCLAQGISSWRNTSVFSRGLEMAGSAMSLLLFSSTVFSMLCWTSKRIDISLSLLRHCDWGSATMDQCHRRLAWSIPYFHWTPEQVNREVAAIQLIIYIAVMILSLLYFFFSIKGTFTLRQPKQHFYIES